MAQQLILFDETKGQKYTLAKGFRTLARRLRTKFDDFKVESEQTQISAQVLHSTSVFVIANPLMKYTEPEFKTLKHFVDSGGSVLVMLTDGGEGSSNINYFLEQFNIFGNPDGVVRTSYHRMPHPKEALLSTNDKCLISRELHLAVSESATEFCYPYGCTLGLDPPAKCIALSGPIAFPVHRPIIAVHESQGSGGRLMVLGSTHIFHDAYIDTTGTANARMAEIVFAWLLQHPTQVELELSFNEIEIGEYKENPCTEQLFSSQKGILQGGDRSLIGTGGENTLELLHNASNMNSVGQAGQGDGSGGLYRVDTQLLPNVFKAHGELDINKEPLSLIPPNFETPLPPLQPAVFPAIFDEPNTPALELFDLDQELSPEQTRLAQLTNRCNTRNLEYFIQECGRILNIEDDERSSSNKPDNQLLSASAIMHTIAKHLAAFKMVDAGL